MKKDKELPPDWPEDWPQNFEEFEKTLKSNELLEYLEDRGIYLRFDDKTGTVKIMKKPEP